MDPKVVPVVSEADEAEYNARKAKERADADESQHNQRGAYTAGRAEIRVREEKEAARLAAIRAKLPLEEQRFFDGVQTLMKRGSEWGNPSRSAVEEMLRRADGHAGKAGKMLKEKFDHEMAVRRNMGLDAIRPGTGDRAKARKKAELKRLGQLMNSTLEGDDGEPTAAADAQDGDVQEEYLDGGSSQNQRGGGSWKNKLLFLFGLGTIIVVLDIAAEMEFRAGMIFKGIV